MRLLFLAGSLTFIAAAASFACSSATPASNATDAGTKATASPTSSSGSVESSSGSATTSSGSTTTGDDDDSTDAGDAGMTDAGDSGTGTTSSSGGLQEGTDAGPACTADAYGEVEPNNDQNSANVLPITALGVTHFCGTTTNADDDWFTFKSPDGTRSFKISNIPGGVEVDGTVNGEAFNINQNQFPNDFPAGAVWLMHVHADNANSHAYNIRLEFDGQ